MTSAADPQAKDLYEWEMAFVEPRCPAEIMSAVETRLLIKRVSILLAIPEPTVTFTSIPVSCKAYPYLNRLEIADWGRSHVTILHEMAHLATWRTIEHGDTPHGRAFTTMAILLYNRFLNIPIDYLEETARLKKLLFYPAKSHALAHSPQSKDFFPDDF